jgi:protein-S-isoprenylcysteine O-methyltransferase Ste14
MTWRLLAHDPALLERRLAGPGSEKEPEQKRIQIFTSIFVLAVLIVSTLDYRFGWSLVPTSVVILGDVLVALGFLVVSAVFRENSFASSTIQIATDQRVISTGPYAWVRHPMYSGALLLFVGVPLALGSWWCLLAVIPLIASLIARLRHEELYLLEKLPGYADYHRRVRNRLVPGVW